VMELGAEVVVKRNDAITVDEALALDPQGILISPGPCTPNEAGISVPLVGACEKAKLPLLGVCLGHQSIGQHFGGRVTRGGLMHGKTSLVDHDGTGVFKGLPSPYTATRYHSLIVDDIPDCLLVNATSETPGLDGTAVMGFRHKDLPIHGVQFHPESIATEHGHALLANFLEICGIEAKAREKAGA
jgi:anthranilate synthase component 2